MVDQVRSFMEADWKKISKEFSDFNEAKQASLKKTMASCAADTEFSLADKDLDHDNFKYFALCLRNRVSLNPAINNSKGIRRAVLGWQY